MLKSKIQNYKILLILNKIFYLLYLDLQISNNHIFIIL